MKRLVLVATSSLLALSAVPSWAQDAQGAEDEAQPGDIVVTATRENTLLSKTPIALTAITGDGLRDAGVTDSRALTNVVPNLQISANGDAARISIRGVTSTDLTEKGDPSAAFLVNGVYVARPIEALNSFFDLERVEVLRGPQGTLYGRNTTAGVINVITARPKDEFGASVDASYGNLDAINATGMINVPIGNGIGLRAAVNYDRSDNYVIQAKPNTVSINPFRDLLSARLSLGGDIGDSFNFVVVADYTKAKGVIYNSVPVRNFFPSAAAPTPTVDPVYVGRSARAQRTAPALGFADSKSNEFYGISGELTYDFGSAALTYLGSYRKTNREDVRNFLLFGALNNPAFFFGDFKQNSHELRLAFGKEQPLHGQVGGYYFHELSFLELNIGPPLSGRVIPGATGFAFPQGPTKATSKAAFGQLTYDLTPDLHITGGIRYTSDDKSRDGRTVVDFPTLAARPGFLLANCVGLRCTLNQNIAKRNYKKTTWKAGIDYDAPNLGLIYATVSTGYKAGGFNDGCVTGQGVGCARTEAELYYNPETLTSYEAGFKWRFGGNALRLNGSIFHYDYKSLQLSQIVTVPVPATLTKNAGVAKVDGVELEAFLQPGDNDLVELGFTYTDARYTDFLPDAGRPTFRFDGKQLDHAPKYTATAAYTHTFPLGNGGVVEATARTRLSSEYFMQDLNNLSQFRQPGYTKTDLTLTYRAAESRYYIQGFVKNLENEITLAAASTGLAASATPEEPRTYGVRAGFKF